VNPLAAARELAPRIAAAGDQIERERRLPAELVAAMAEAGIFRMLVPRSLGGGEVDVATFSRVVETIGAADGSTAWCVSQGSVSATVAAFLAPGVARELFGKPTAIMAQGVAHGPRAMVAPGGFQVSGEWSFGSGCRHATWLNAGSPVYEADGAPRRGPGGGQETRVMLFPADQAEIRDTWQVSGLRGTGSDTYAVRDLFIPEARTVSYAREAQRREPGPLYTFSTGLLFATGFASVALGIARGALDAFEALANEKQPRAHATLMRENPLEQARVAQAEAALRSARAFLDEAIGAAWETASRGDQASTEQKVLLRLAATSAIRRAGEVTDAAYHAAGATAVFESNRFERRFRDANAVTQQFQGSEVHFPAMGRHFLGLGPAASSF
jgi:alkylation response protein AidB-like acyl-CoA dehydrogenase